PKGEEWERALDYWRSLPTDEDAKFDSVVTLDATDIVPSVTWGTTPAQSVPVTGRVQDPGDFGDAGGRELAGRAPVYLDLKPATAQRLFDGRQGPGRRTHRGVPRMAAAAAIVGHVVDIREWRQD